MRKLAVILAAALCLCGAVVAQNDSTPAPATQPVSVTLSAGSPSLGHGRASRGSDNSPWQLGTNFLYQRYDFGSSGDNTSLFGLHTSIARFLGESMFAIEGAATATWGNFSPMIKEHQVFYGGGVKVAMRGRRVQPWAHFLAGGVHLRFTQTIGNPSFNGFAFMAGGGIDYKLSNHLALRVQVDYLRARVSTFWHNDVNVGGGIVVLF